MHERFTAASGRPPTRLGIIGCGSVFRAYASLIEAMRVDRAVEVVAACDVDPAKQAEVTGLWPDARFTDDFRELVQQDDVDLVMVLATMPVHGPATRAALEAGKHVLVEKPVATTLEEAREILDLAAAAPGELMCAPHICLSPTYQTMLNRVRANDIGRVVLARGRYGHSGPRWAAWYYRKGGGALFDLGVYNLTALTGFLGPAKRVTAFCGIAQKTRLVAGATVEVEAVDNAHVLLDFGDQVFAAVTTGFTMQRYRSPAIELYGTNGTLQLMGDDWAPQGYELWQPSTAAWQIFEDEDPRWEWTEGLRHFVQCIRTGRLPMTRPEHAFHVLEIMLKAEQAAADGQAREIESVFPPLELSALSDNRMPEHDRRVARVD